jgi:hypothetical protein
VTANLIIENILLAEGRVEDFEKAYARKLGLNACRALEAGDPSGNHKYLDWAGRRMVAEPDTEPEHLMSLLALFHQKVRKTDIYSVKSVAELAKLTGGAPRSDGQTKLDKEKNVIYQDDEFTIYAPQTHEASCAIDGYNWCIGRGSDTYWNDYYNKGQSVVMVMRKGEPINDEEREEGVRDTECAIVGDSFDSADVWDSSDDRMDREERSNYLSNLPDKARDAIEHWFDYDDEQTQADEKFEEDGVRTICSAIATLLRQRGVEADHDAVKDAIDNCLPETETVREFCWRIWDNSISNHGLEEAGWIGNDWDDFVQAVEDSDLGYNFEPEALVQYLSRIDQVDDLIARFTQHPANFVERDDVYNAVLKSLDRKNAINRDSEQRFLRLDDPHGARPRHNNTPRTIRDLIQMLRDSDFGEIADEIEADRLRDPKGNVYESSDAYSGEDIAALYVEEGLGRHDWIANWKSLPDQTESLREWLQEWHPAANLAEIKALVDQWAAQEFKFR